MAASLVTAFMAEAGLITYRSFHQGIQQPAQSPLPLPLPANYTAVIFVYSILGLAPGALAGPAGVVGWGLVVATLLNLWQPTYPKGPAGSGKPITVTPPGGNPTTYTTGPGGTITQPQGPPTYNF